MIVIDDPEDETNFIEKALPVSSSPANEPLLDDFLRFADKESEMEALMIQRSIQVLQEKSEKLSADSVLSPPIPPGGELSLPKSPTVKIRQQSFIEFFTSQNE